MPILNVRILPIVRKYDDFAALHESHNYAVQMETHHLR